MKENNTPDSALVTIDEHALDKECIRLPSDYLRAAYRAAEAKKDVDEAKAALDVIEADIQKRVRANPEDYGIDKITESAIAATVALDKKRKEAANRVIDTRYQQELCQALVWALEHKKRSLTLLVDLYGMSYFTEPKLSGEGRKAMEEMTRRKTSHRSRREDEE